MQLVDPISYAKLDASERLPSPKGLALAIVRLLKRDDYRIDDLVRLIQSDPVISGELLKFSNAASLGHSRPIVSLSHAIATLGTHRVRVIVIALSVLQNHRSGNCPQFDYEQFWSRSLASAIAAQALAAHGNINGEENFTAGLFCCIGELAMASIFPDRYGEIISASRDGSPERLALERAAFGYDHRGMNASLLLEWGLPEALVTAIYHCEAPDDADLQDGSRIHRLTLSLHVARIMAKICVADDAVRWAMLPNLYAKAARLGISTEEMNSMADSITASWIDWGEQLKIQTREITSFAELLTSSQPREQASSISTACPWPNMSVLLIDSDSPESAEIARLLETNGYTVEHASSSTEGLAAALKGNPNFVIIEMSAPEIDAVAFCKALRGKTTGQAIYIFLIVDHEDELYFARALDMGADDLLPRPITAFSMQNKLRGASRIIQLQNDLIKERNSLVNSAGEWAGANRRLTHVAMTDPLTQLPNRRYGMDALATEWTFAKANNLPLACLMIDIDHFKSINDKHGHKAGDAVLTRMASLLQAGARSQDLVFRYGGEEFCVVCPGVNLETACDIAERIRQNVEGQSFHLANVDIELTVSIGVAMMLPAHADEEALLHAADTALYRAKNAGRNRVVSG